MLEYAQKRGCYDELVAAELCAFMRSRPDAFDAILCADTLVCLGALEEPLAAAHHVLREDRGAAVQGYVTVVTRIDG